MNVKSTTSTSTATTFYVAASIRMRTGCTEYARFHAEMNPCALDERAQAKIIVQLLRDKGLSPADVADDAEPVATFAVWDNEADCKSAYAEMVAHANAKPDQERAQRGRPGAVFLNLGDRSGTATSNIREYVLDMGATLLRTEQSAPEVFIDRSRDMRTHLASWVDHAVRAERLDPSDINADAMIEALMVENDMALEWARCGFPRVQMRSHEVASEMMYTHSRSEALAEVQPPWQCFWIDVPTDMIRVSDPRGGLVEVTNLFVWFNPSGVRIAYGNRVDFVANWWVPSLAECGHLESCGPGERLLAALLVSICLDFTVRRPAPTRRRPPPRRPGVARAGALPDTLDYVIVERAVMLAEPRPGQEIATGKDILRAVRGYARGEPSTQRLHRGHFQLQTCGPRWSQRRLQYHRPYWQGPKDAPIAVRPHERR